MNKKIYISPVIAVVEIQSGNEILAGSFTPWADAKDGNYDNDLWADEEEENIDDGSENWAGYRTTLHFGE